MKNNMWKKVIFAMLFGVLPGVSAQVRIPPYRDRPFRLNVTVCSG